MTYTIFELHRVVCDECEIAEEDLINVEFENIIDRERSFIGELIGKGWVYNKENEQHFCPKCVEVGEDEE